MEIISNPTRKIKINDIELELRADCPYRFQYAKALEQVVRKERTEAEQWGRLILGDLWFVVYFVLRVPIANHPFWVRACWDVQSGPDTQTVDLWARDHGKSTIITIAETIRQLMRDPERRFCIYSYTRSAAQAFLRSIKLVFETSELLKFCFPDVLWECPERQAFKWSEEGGLYLKRNSVAKEGSVEAWGLIEGMPTGRHFTDRVYDDIETLDLVNTPELMQKCKESFDMSHNTGTVDGRHRVVGTPYHHEGTLTYICGQLDEQRKPLYYVRRRPATVDGTPNGASVYLPEERLALLRNNKRIFYSQQLLDPTPLGTQKLEVQRLKWVKREDLPQALWNFMVVDPAGGAVAKPDGRGNDAWAAWVVGVEPYRDDLGFSNIYLKDGFLSPAGYPEAVQKLTELYLSNGLILKLGIEATSVSTAEMHIASALRARGRNITVENGGIVILRPAGRAKVERILAALEVPLMHGKIHVVNTVPLEVIERFKREMEKFPFWHDDGLDALAYVYDIIKNYKFGSRPLEQEPGYARRDYRDKKQDVPRGWLVH